MYKFENILNYVSEKKDLDFSGFRVSMLERRIQKRIFSTHCQDIKNYYRYLCDNEVEVDCLVDELTINVSRFFRDALEFEYLRCHIFPELISKKMASNQPNLRIWSAGCSYGEEPYSVALILDELLQKEAVKIQVNIFATDIDSKAILEAKKGSYKIESLENVKQGIFNKYFIRKDNRFEIKHEIRNRICFSYFDLLDKKSQVPKESIYGSFDVVFCRNVLIYYNEDYQDRILSKLYNSINSGGLLVLGETEAPTEKFKVKFKKENSCCKIYRRVG